VAVGVQTSGRTVTVGLLGSRRTRTPGSTAAAWLATSRVVSGGSMTTGMAERVDPSFANPPFLPSVQRMLRLPGCRSFADPACAPLARTGLSFGLVSAGRGSSLYRGSLCSGPPSRGSSRPRPLTRRPWPCPNPGCLPPLQVGRPGRASTAVQVGGRARSSGLSCQRIPVTLSDHGLKGLGRGGKGCSGPGGGRDRSRFRWCVGLATTASGRLWAVGLGSRPGRG
jgi:hypothetical protein